LIYLLEESLRIDDHAVPEHADLVRMDDPGRQEAKYECLVADIYAVTGIVTALIP
jgi:hypothetical protein